jgi:ribonuclease D
MLVKDPSTLGRIASELKREMAIGVDLEADSMFHYHEKVCLIQISTPLQNILVDPLSLDDLSALSPIFSDPNIRKVFHGADYDMRSLYRDFNLEVNSLFDTQIAARFLGIRETSLASLLKEKLEVLVEKKYQKKDWSERPLSAAMLAYAVQDTCHLLPLSRMLEKELRVKGRLFCVEEECKLLSKVRPVSSAGNPLFLRFKGASRLDLRGLAVLESILQLRDDTARLRGVPPFKILGNATIMELAERKPVTERDLERIKGLSAGQARMLGRSILKQTVESMTLLDNELPAFPRNSEPRIGGKALKKVKALKEWRERRAKEMGVDPSLVCTNAQIESLALAHPERQKDLEDIDTLRAWQRRLFGSEICGLFKRHK